MITGAYLSFWDKFDFSLLEKISKDKLKFCGDTEIKKNNKLKVITCNYGSDSRRDGRKGG